MSENISSGDYLNQTLHNTLNMIGETIRDSDGKAKNLSSELAAGVLIAHSNVAIAAALATIADQIARRPL